MLGTYRTSIIVLALLGLQACLLWVEARNDSATWDEVGHFAAGFEHVNHGRFQLYPVNPPLVRLLASVPLALTHPELDPDKYSVDRRLGRRPEFEVGAYMARDAGCDYFHLLAIARWTCIPFSLLGGLVCYRWARELWGRASGLIALGFWVFSPSVLAYGHLITPDIGATGIGIAAAYLFRRWLIRPGFGRAMAAGFGLGLAELTKTTWVVLFGVLPALWIFHRLQIRRPIFAARAALSQVPQIASILLISLWVINLGYGFEGSLTPLRQYEFLSEAFGGSTRVDVDGSHLPGNHFRNSWAGRVPIPLPESYIRGIDFIKMEYERKYWSFLRGEWRFGGWWYYYLYAMLVKEPEGTWLLGAMAVGVTVFGRKVYNAGFREELLLLAPAVVVIALVSSQTGFNHHLRYVLPAYPFLFIWMSKLARSFTAAGAAHRAVAVVVSLSLGWSIISSLSVFPHSMSYFNWTSGGPKNGNRHLGNSNTDWGQDLLYLQKWYEAHDAARPLYLGYDLPLVDPRILGIDWRPLPVGPSAEHAALAAPEDLGPKPGWFAVSVNWLQDGQHRWDYFKELTPVDWVGYTMPIYHISLEEANAMRHKYGMPLLPSQPPSTQATKTTIPASTVAAPAS